MKKAVAGGAVLLVLCIQCLCFPAQAYAGSNEDGSENVPTPGELYAKAAVLMDGATGRVLYEKNGSEILPMASTTKVMTAIVALENASLDDEVTISSYASGMPDVQLNARAGERYFLKDLMYSLMLESHNDTAAAIAEHVGGSIENFAAMMNEKAAALGCQNTYFITPNGLDAENEGGVHATTAVDLARIMRYAIDNEDFLEITRSASHTFTDLDGKRTFTVNNKNALLTMTDEAISGKTGFTGNAGFCYTCAAESDGRTFIIALLGCGWPPNKSWKWTDTRKLIAFAKENYELVEVGIENYALEPVKVVDGVKERVFVCCDTKKWQLLLGKHERFWISSRILTQTEAPVKAGATAGYIYYMIGDHILCRYPISCKTSVAALDYRHYWQKIFASWCGI